MFEFPFEFQFGVHSGCGMHLGGIVTAADRCTLSADVNHYPVVDIVAGGAIVPCFDPRAHAVGATKHHLSFLHRSVAVHRYTYRGRSNANLHA